MKETLAEIMTASAFLLSPQPMEQPVVEPASNLETLVDNENAASGLFAQPENPESIPVDSDPAEYTVGFLHNESDVLPPHSDGQHNVAILESFDPNTAEFWLEFGIGSLGLGGAGSFIANRRLKGSLRKDHATIKDGGWEVQDELSKVLEAAKQQALGLHNDDVPKLRELIEEYDQTSVNLLSALASTDSEFDDERSRFFALKRRLHKAPHTSLVIKTTKTAAQQAQDLRRELERVQTDLNDIDTTIGHAESTVSSLQRDLDALTQKGWDLGVYEQLTAGFANSVAAAQAKRNENYIDVPTQIAKNTVDEALKLKEKVGTLESRRMAADEVYGTQSGRIAEAEATAEKIRGCFAKLQDTYSAACLVDFEDLQDELTEALAALASAHETGGNLTDSQGLSVEAVEHSEELNKSFEATLEEIQGMEVDLREREEHLAMLAVKLPREVRRLNSQFGRALELADDSDVEGDTRDEIRALDDDVTNLSTSISTAEGQKPDYLDIERRHLNLAEEVNQALSAATAQKQEMDDLRTDIPQLTDGYNGLVTTIRDFSKRPKLRLQEKTLSDIKRLQNYEYPIASDRQNLRRQKKQLNGLIRETHKLIRRIEQEAEEDGALLKAVKVVGGTTLAIVIGVDLLD